MKPARFTPEDFFKYAKPAPVFLPTSQPEPQLDRIISTNKLARRDASPSGRAKCLSLQNKLALLDDDSALALVAIVDLPHLIEIIEPADDIGGTE
jgi:hypothetical protein